MPTRAAFRRTACALLCAIAFATPVAVQAQSTRYDPRLHFRTLTSERFTIYYHQREEDLAKRLAGIAEDVAVQIDARLGAARGRVHVIVVDQTDQSNGWATVIPYNLIEIAAVPPPGHSLIGNTDDWLRVVFTHEYTHVVHLEKSGGWLGSLRRVFGRLPLFYPNLSLPDWQIEGIATHEETALTAGGRLAAGDFRMILDRAAAEGRFASLDRATSAVIDWPSGHSPYLYGGFFHQYLADKYGRESLERLADETGGRLPFFGSRAFHRVYGRSLGALWADFEAHTRARLREHQEPDARTRLTHHGFSVTSPLYTRDGRLFYAVANPHGFPALMELPAGGSSRQVATRYRGNRLTETDGLLVFDQLEVVNQVDVQSDLYVRAIDGGRTRRLTRHARAADPDVAPDGATIVCTVQQTGRRVLATLKIPPGSQLARPAPLVAEDSTEFSTPRWSPDGRSIAAVRRRLGGPSEIVVIDVDRRVVRTVVSSSRARHIFPVWLPDGRTLLFSSDRGGGPFTLYAADVRTGAVRRVTRAGTGAQAPALSPDGRIVFVGYSADGHDLYSIPFEPATWEIMPVEPVEAPAATDRSSAARSTQAVEDRTYRPWPTLAPRFWVPAIESDASGVKVGAATGGSDVLGRHSYWASGTWALDGNRPDVDAGYVYARWWPALFASVSTETSGLLTGEFRSRELSAGATLPVRRVRWTSTAMAAFFTSRDSRECTTCDAADSTRTRGALRMGWSVSSAKAFGYSISAEQGFSFTAASELTRRALGADANAGAVTADARRYFRVSSGHHVIAARAAAASSWGDERMRRVFTAGGSGPRPGGFGFDADAIGLLRGFEESDLFGNHAAVLNVDYRFPIAWLQRGVGTFPFFIRSIHGALFADAGHAWDEAFKAAHVRRSAGAEVSFDTVLAHRFPLSMTAGVAWRQNDERDRRGVAVFGRFGRAF